MGDVIGSQEGMNREHVVEQVMARLAERVRGGDAGTSPRQRSALRQSIATWLFFLDLALREEDIAPFVQGARQVASVLRGFGLPPNEVESSLEDCRREVVERIPRGSRKLAKACFEGGHVELWRPTPEGRGADPLLPMATEFLEHLLHGRTQAATVLVNRAVQDGAILSSLFLGVFQPCLREVGRRWQAGSVTVGQEHFCTAAVQRIVSHLYATAFSGVSRIGKRVVAVSAPGELHEVGLRAVCDFLEMDGWDSYYMGANVPVESVVDGLRQPPADLLLVSTTIVIHLPGTQSIIEAVRASAAGSAAILLGGVAMNANLGIWRSMGADGVAEDAATVVAQARRLVGMSGA